MYKFSAASENESIVFGSARPGYSDRQVNEWIKFMQHQNIKCVCCLLSETQLNRYSNLLETYRQSFGIEKVCWALIKDFHLVNPTTLTHQVLPFLAAAHRRSEKVVVHCSGGVGRTGHILVAWLVAGRGFSSPAAIAAVQKSGRNPYEAMMAAPFIGQNPCRVAADFKAFLDMCHSLQEVIRLP